MKISKLRSAIYDKVWHSPKMRLTGTIRRKCDSMSQKQRLTVVTIMLSAFILIAFIVFGHACYKLGLGHRSELKVEHIRQLDVSKSNPAKDIADEVAR